MKKFIASVMVVCISATFLFAGTPAVPAHDEYAFFDVEGVELTDAEKNEVEGGFVVAGVVITTTFVVKLLATGSCIAIVGNQIKQNSIIKSTSNERLTGKPGEIKKNGYKETKIGSNGKAEKERHNTDHSNPKVHTNPHDHIISSKSKGNPSFGKPINYPNGTSALK